jgi:serine/threonine-protein kinase
MEYVAGETLADLLRRRGRLEPDEAVALALQACVGLETAHEAGLVHRDVKPQNLLVTPGGTVKIADFGIARVLDEDAGLTRTGFVAGTPAYMPPEARRGAEPDPRADVYALGAVLYEMIAGAPPQGAFPPLSPRLDRIVRRALAPSPEARYESTDAMRRELLALAPRDTGGLLHAGVALADDEETWIRAVALLQSLATCAVLWAVLLSVTPRTLAADAMVPLVMIGAERLPDGRLFSRARFETGPTLLAVASVIAALAGLAALRRHWRMSGLEAMEPDRPLRGARRVLAGGVVVIAMFLLRLFLESRGQWWARTYVPVLGGAVEIAVVYVAWRTVLEAWRVGRPLVREPLLFAGLLLAVLPPTLQLWIYVAATRHGP